MAFQIQKNNGEDILTCCMGPCKVHITNQSIQAILVLCKHSIKKVNILGFLGSNSIYIFIYKTGEEKGGYSLQGALRCQLCYVTEVILSILDVK